MRVHSTKFWMHSLLALVLLCGSQAALAQPGKLELRNLDKLAEKAAEVNDVTLDGALLQLASVVLQKSDDPDATQVRELIKDLKGIYVKNFEFDEPNQYSQADVQAIRAQLTGPGWQRVVESRSKRDKEHDEIYLLKQGNDITGVTILVAEAKELTVVNIVGKIDFEKLGELGGHFGIPDEINDHAKKPRAKPSATPTAKPSQGDKKDSGNEEE